MRNYLLALGLSLLLVGCACKSNYHELALDRGPTLGSDGVLVGIEKYKWSCVGQEKGVDLSRFKISDPEDPSSKLFATVANQTKAMVVTHVLEFKNGERIDNYNPFIANKDAEPNYDQGYEQLDKLRTRLKAELESGRYTHVVFISMGWHNDQYESIKRYREIIAEMEKRDSSHVFRPYVVAITWPSAWGSNSKSRVIEKVGHIISYLNKPHDADEIGFTTANYLLHNVILSAVGDVNALGGNIKTVAIGHSMGARLISRAIFSGKYLKEDRSGNTQLDLFVGLEPAFSANRFVQGGGIEGSPYESHGETKTKFLITTSEFDKANPVAFWSEHLGGKDAFDTVKKRGADYNFYNAAILNDRINGLALEKLWQSPKRVEFVNCAFIADHNDILDDEMGLFLYEIVNRSGI